MKCEECKYCDKTERICYYMGENRCVDNEEQTEDAISRQDLLDMAITLTDIANPDKEWEVVPDEHQ